MLAYSLFQANWNIQGNLLSMALSLGCLNGVLAMKICLKIGGGQNGQTNSGLFDSNL
jgi:hypothetical protein